MIIQDPCTHRYLMWFTHRMPQKLILPAPVRAVWDPAAKQHCWMFRLMAIILFQWNLVCENKYKISMSNTIFFAGVFFGALIFGFISDCVGRKKTLAICLYLQMPISLAIAFIPNYLGFVILRFLLGVWLQVFLHLITCLFICLPHARSQSLVYYIF